MTGLRRLSVLATGLALAALPAVAMAQVGQGYYDGHMWGGGGHGWFFVPLMMVFWLVVLVGAVVLILRWLGGTDAIDILRERFAKGEIEKAEFEERRALLEK
jgi:putative membrane protein